MVLKWISLHIFILLLQVLLDAPVCASKQNTQHSVAKLENAEILCKVHANPSTVTFRWTFNNTAEAIDVPEGRFVVTATESRVNYTPMNELDYGTLLCWANNSIGIQDHPCVFHIVAAGKPDPPHNCRVFDVTISSLQVTCLAGDDGGLTQQFIIQVFKIGATSPISEITKTVPSFSVTNLRPATAYKILVVALNEKGASRPSELKAYTVRVPETQEETSAEPTRDRDRDLALIPLPVIIGLSVGAVPVVLVISFVIWYQTCRRNRNPRRQSSPLDDDSKTLSMRKSGGAPCSESAQSVIASCKESTRSSLELPLSTDSSTDECNPDVISQATDPSESTKNFHGDISLISTSSSGYFLGNGGSSFMPSKCASSVSGPVVDYLQIIGREVVHSPIGGSSCGTLPLHTPSTPLLPLNLTGSIQVPYSSHKEGTKLCPTQSNPQILEVPLPPPEFYNQGYQAKDQKCINDKCRNNDYSERNIKDNNFAHPFSHLYQPSCSQFPHLHSNAKQYSREHCKDSLHSIPCFISGSHRDGLRSPQECECSSLSSPSFEILDPQARKCNKKFHHGTPKAYYESEMKRVGDEDNISNQSAFLYGTLRRGNVNSKENGEQKLLRRGSSGNLKGSMPDVRDKLLDNDNKASLSEKSKRESAV